MTQAQTRFNVGGLLLDRPFKIRRLGHFGFNVVKMEEARHFYTDLLGFRVSDVANFSGRLENPDLVKDLGAHGYFTRYGGDHHAFVLFNKGVFEAMGRRFRPGVTINQITWQVGSLREVVNAIKWFSSEGVQIERSGRDMPGSNWHTYILDSDGNTNELYYGIEQVGWTGHSKPLPMHNRRFAEAPELPQISEFDEVQQALADGVDPLSGYRHVDALPAKYDVGGIMLARPFKIVRIGPVSLFAQDVNAAEAFYRDVLGFVNTEDVVWEGHRCAFLRSNTEHHVIALYPMALRERLGLSDHTNCMAFGVQLADYAQLKDAVKFLRDHGVRVVDSVPPDLYPGIDYAAHVQDPEGHCIQLYYGMEQIGWDGRPRPKELRRPTNGEWPESLAAVSDTYGGEPFLGPWG